MNAFLLPTFASALAGGTSPANESTHGCLREAPDTGAAARAVRGRAPWGRSS